MNKKLQNMAVLIEFIFGSGLAIFFHWVLHYREAAYSIFGIGLLLSVATYLIREDIEKSREQVLERYTHAHEITFAIARISDPECKTKSHEVMSSFMRTLSLLEQGYIPMVEMEYYLDNAKMTEQAAACIKTVDPLISGLDSRGASVNFQQTALRACDRGVKMNRIFIGSREEMAIPEVQKILAMLYHENIDLRIAFREELPATGTIEATRSLHFAIYDDRIVAEVFSKTGNYYGRKTSRRDAVAKYLHLFDLIEHSSHAITMEEDRLVPSNAAVPVAA